MRSISVLVLAALLAACASKSPARPGEGGSLGEIATTPLSDLNLVREKIPEVLLTAKRLPYAMPETLTCAALADEVRALDAVLGADLDVPPNPSDPSLLERGGGLASEAALGVVRGAAQGVVPFRSWVRKLTGAERHSREVAAAIAAGTVRRAFLKGLGQAAGCAPPAAPCAEQPVHAAE